MEYTLEDAYETLKEIKVEIEKEIEELADIISNNEVGTLNQSLTAEEIQSKYAKFYGSLMKHIKKEVSKDYPIPRTSDLRAEVVAQMEQEIRDMQSLFGYTKSRLADIETDIAHLQNKKNVLEKTKDAYLYSVELNSNRTYETEQSITKRIFKEVKNDLYYVVDTIFPDNEGFKELLAALTAAYAKGGDDVYIEVIPDVLDHVNFMVEADLVVCHRNDKNKIKIVDLI